MASKKIIILIAFASYAVCTGQPVEKYVTDAQDSTNGISHTLWRRFINTLSPLGDSDIHIRDKRSVAEDCEKLELCMLHARSAHSFLAAYELYFVNKENAKLWDHRAHTPEDCQQRFNCYEY